MAVASRESAREDRWRREPGNLGTTEFSRAKPPAATGRRNIHARCCRAGSMPGNPTRGRASAPSKSASPARGMSDTKGPRQMRAVGQESKYCDRGVRCHNGLTPGHPLGHPLRSREWRRGWLSCYSVIQRNRGTVLYKKRSATGTFECIVYK